MNCGIYRFNYPFTELYFLVCHVASLWWLILQSAEFPLQYQGWEVDIEGDRFWIVRFRTARLVFISSIFWDVTWNSIERNGVSFLSFILFRPSPWYRWQIPPNSLCLLSDGPSLDAPCPDICLFIWFSVFSLVFLNWVSCKRLSEYLSSLMGPSFEKVGIIKIFTSICMLCAL